MTAPPTQPSAPVARAGYVNCRCCNAIVGYTARIDGALFLHTFSHAVKYTSSASLQTRTVNARMLDGDIYCTCCGTWQRWEIPLPRVAQPERAG